ncbi:MAG TPA: UDP-N-acetylglucosamine--N-acetylmuramyl-(pentapeptide) pyrophosphoryl-undecaprenol N-acetylglucosamine transferase [Candidatus Saccharimonadales bacterium]|nr:UDP-N-acetylglucosamine--N-acetylmuramyl-(pentapeptide) pyrophosphoryl-undecaprenol N-acetylglucosamine transferase [Candidatus Saccharimonadales bacterium]
MKLLITSGGGGHFSPALAVIEKLPKDIEFLIVGRKYAFEGDNAISWEYQTAQALGLPFVPLTTARFQRKFTRHTIPSFTKLPRGFFQAVSILRDFKPDVVLSFGGYVSVPVVFAAAFLRTPIIIHEQTLEAGVANKIAARFAKKICTSWQSSEDFFPKRKIVLTGNPIREFPIAKFQFPVSDEDLPLVYITGGSLGAHVINTLVEKSLEKLLNRFRIIHQTGDAGAYHDFERLQSLQKSLDERLQKRYEAVKFVDAKTVGTILQKADLVVSRCGVNTISELLYFEKPSFLIPLPFAQKNEQRKNALFLKSIGLAEVFEQKALDEQIFFSAICNMIENKKNYKLSAQNKDEFIHKDAAQNIVKEVLHAAAQKSK